MNDISTLPAEKENLELHVDLCAQRYLLLEKRLGILEVKMDKLNDDIVKGQKSLSTVIIGSATTIVAGLIGLITTILMKF
jgi:hypothetical protein